jgi:transcriptional regulator with AAA-type ATPase domain
MKTQLFILDRCLDVIRREIPSDWAYLYLEENGLPPALCRSSPPDREDAVEVGRVFGPELASSQKSFSSVWMPDHSDQALKFIHRKIRVLGLSLVFGLGKKAVILLGRRIPSKEYTNLDLRLLRILVAPLRQVLLSFVPPPISGPSQPGGELLLGISSSHCRVLKLIDRLKDFNTPVFITGESGTGKELVAKSIHYGGARSAKRFVAVNCCAIPENLLESELFGYVRGAFTGAFRDKAGLIEEANGGTFFLDEVGDLPLYLQTKLLRLLQEREIRRVGETRQRKVDVRFISATHRNIEEEVSKGCFRKDLYFRLKIIAVRLPALRERRQDIPLLLDHYLNKYSRELNCFPCPSLTPEALKCLMNYDWPGNIRELQNEIQRFLIFCSEGNVISAEYLSPRMRTQIDLEEGEKPYGFFRARADFEKNFIREALCSCDFHRERTAAKIGLSRQGLYKLIKKHGIPLDENNKGIMDGNIIDQKENFC